MPTVWQIHALHFILPRRNRLKPSSDKVRAVKGCGIPESKEAVRYFIGMEELSAIGEKTEEKDAFKKIQDSGSNEKTMTFFDPNRPIILRIVSTQATTAPLQ